MAVAHLIVFPGSQIQKMNQTLDCLPDVRVDNKKPKIKLDFVKHWLLFVLIQNFWNKSNNEVSSLCCIDNMIAKTLNQVLP